MAFGGGVSRNNPAASSFQVQTSNYGRAIPICYGTNQVSGNLIWYNNFRSQAQKSSAGGKGGGSQVTGYTYTVAALLGICEGPLSSISEQTSNQWSYRGFPGSTTYTYTGIRTVYTGQSKYTPANLNMTVYTGTTTQTPFPYITSNYPTEALNYKTLAYVAASSYNLGSSPSMPQQMFEVVGLLANAGSNGIYDANPYNVAFDLLTNTRYGIGFPSAKLSNVSGNYLYAAGLWISPVYNSPTPAAELIQNIAKLCNCEWVWSGGVLKFVPYAVDSITGGPGVTLAQGSTALGTLTYTPGSLATPVYALTDADFVQNGTDDPIIVTRNPQADAYNTAQLRYKDRWNDYADSVMEAKDQSSIELFGVRSAPIVDAPEICDGAVARAAVQLYLQRVLYIRNTYKFTLSYRYILLDPMDLVTLTESTGTGLNNQVVRITSITENEDGSLDCEAEDVIGNVTTAAVYPYQYPSGYQVNYNSPPGSVNAPTIFDAPGRMTATGYEVWMAIAGSGQYWGGANVWVSLDGTTYKQVGVLQGRCRYGVSTSAIAVQADPDTVSTLGVNLTTSQGSLSTASTSDADNNNTLCLIDNELVSYSTATLTSTYNYNLSAYTRRGVYGTTVAAHSVGARFVRLDNRLFAYSYDPSLIGKTIYVKLQSFNIWGAGTEDISTVTAYTYTIAGPIGAPQDVTGLAATPAIGGIQLSWTAVAAPDLFQYEIRQGSTWATATLVGKSLTTNFLVPTTATGTTTWLVKAVNKTNVYSVNAASVSLGIVAPSAPTVSAQVIDNNVLLTWNAVSSTLPIATYQIRKGAVFASATVIGTKSGLFTSVFENVAGTYTYWVVGIDTFGNVGTAGSIAAVVSAPPDYVLKSLTTSTFSGTKTNSIIDTNGKLILPVDITTQYQTHFTGNAWASPNDQVVAGKPLFIEPASATGSYAEIVDLGAVIPASKVTVAWTEMDVGTPAVSCVIAYSTDNISYTSMPAGTAQYLTNFRYVRVTLSATSAAGLDLATISGLTIRIDAKIKNDGGSVSALSTDVNGTNVTFNTSFAAVTSITLTAGQTTSAGAAAQVPIYIFAGGANPTTFAVMLFNSSGTRISGTVNWSAKGY